MDIFSHGLWASAAYKGVNNKKQTKLNIKQAFLWGIFPDLLAFTIPFVWLVVTLVSGGLNFSDVRHSHSVEGTDQNTTLLTNLTTILYNVSHSAVVFIVIFLICYLIFHKPIWTMFAWLLHIIMDIPTHSFAFYPTPVFWPLSDWKFDGYSWGNLTFITINYIVLVVVYIFLLRRNKKTTN